MMIKNSKSRELLDCREKVYFGFLFSCISFIPSSSSFAFSAYWKRRKFMEKRQRTASERVGGKDEVVTFPGPVIVSTLTNVQ